MAVGERLAVYKLLGNCTVSVTWLSRNFFVARSVARSRTQLYFSQRIAAFDNTIAQCITPSSNLSRNFTAVLTRVHVHTSCFFVPRRIARKVAEKIVQCNRASTPNLGNLQR